MSISEWRAAELASMPGRAAVYQPNRTKLGRAIGGSTALVLMSAAYSGGNIADWLHGTATLQANSVAVAVCGFVFLCFGGIGLLSIVRGLPRLTATSEGVTIERPFGTSWAAWSSLADFTVTTTVVGRWNRRVSSATAMLIGSEASKSVLRRKKLTIPDHFLKPIADIVDDLNKRRAEIRAAAGQPVPPSCAIAATDQQSFGLAGSGPPWLTFGILGALVLVFLLEQIFMVNPGGALMRPSVQTLVALGGLNRLLVVTNGEWYRVFTGPLLHIDLLHISLNGFALVLIGYPLERLVGRLWFPCALRHWGLGRRAHVDGGQSEHAHLGRSLGRDHGTLCSRAHAELPATGG